MNLDKNIQAHRKKLNISQEDLGKMLFVSRQTVSMWENGQTQPTLDNLVRLGEIFSVTVDELLNGEQNREENIEGIRDPDVEKYSVQFSSEEVKEVEKRQLWKLYRRVIILTVLTLMFVIWSFCAGDNSVIGFSLILFLCCLFISIRLIVLGIKTWKNSAQRMLETIYKYRFFDEYFELDTYVAGEKGNCYKYAYSEIKVMDEFKNYLLLQVNQSFFLFRRSDMKQDSFLFGYIFRNPDKIKKRKDKEKWQVISMALFVVSLCSIYLALMMTGLMMEVSGTPAESMPSYMWTFFTVTPVPLASVAYGIAQQLKGRKCKKNIIGGLIIFFILCIYGSFAFIF